MDRTKIVWLVNRNILRNSAEKLPDEIRAQGMVCVDYDWRLTDPSPPQIPDWLDHTYCAITYGAIQFVRAINPTGQLQPGALGANDRVNVNSYMSNLPHDWFLNRRGVFVTWKMFKDVGAGWFARFAYTGKSFEALFVRPMSGYKSFAGQLVKWDTFEEDVKTIDELTSVMDETLIMVAPPIPLHGEFRFVIADGKVVTGSEYRWDNVLDIRIDYPQECFDLAQQVAQHDWQVDVAYTCDIALTGEGPKLIELNGFASAGLYACDIKEVVDKVSLAAWREYSGENI